MAQRKGKSDGAVNIVIRREEIVEDGHHGGAWKVAYADFVTAMMAFFLLMWLINAITDDQRRGIAAYFNPLADREHSIGGSGMLPSQPTPFTADSAIAEKLDPSRTAATPQPTHPDPHPAASATTAPAPPLDPAQTATAPIPASSAAASAASSPVPSPGPSGGQQDGDDGARAGRPADDAGGGAGARLDRGTGGAPIIQAVMLAGPALHAAARPDQPAPEMAGDGVAPADRAAASALRDALRADPALADSAGQVDVAATPEGLRVQIMDAESKPMFDSGQAVPNPRAVALLRRIAPWLARLGGPVSIDGHTDAAPYAGGHLSNWTLSSARADAAEQVLVAAGLPEADVAGVTGHAGREPLFAADPSSPANRRIVLTVHRHPTSEATR
ncbi:chemotaxis protein MotB [Endobacter medicaginis]|uniref:Chemotaxis protein MotB n=3 Tax=Endobacter medicaginis TaxID=1181271 RepID=A0A839UVZ6_9PROT|nr:flagellar motor protein MotB [Endobacter medicaginis]MBB3172220.1 chemotaxis protein MotB [Endobacter medicaginis]